MPDRQDNLPQVFRAMLVMLLASASIALVVFGHAKLQSSVGVGHTIYLPAVLAAFWWRIRGISVSIVLSAGLLVAHYLWLPQTSYLLDIMRAVVAVSVSVVVALLSRRIHDDQRDIQGKTIRLRKLARDMSVIEDRQRREIAQEVHDHLTQDLVALKINIGLIAQSDANSDELFNNVQTLVDKLIDASRDLTFDIYPPLLHELGLVPALKWQGDRLLDANGIACRWCVNDLPPLNIERRNWLFRAIRELMMNIMRHSKARSVQISSRVERNLLIIDVRDDGVGFSRQESTPGRQAGNHQTFGLFSIQERLTCFGGRMICSNLPEGGAGVSIRLPVDEESND